MAIAETLRRGIDGHGVVWNLIPHPKTGSTRGSAEAAHIPPDHVAKAVMVKDARGYAMVAVPGDHWVKLQALNADADRQFELAAEQDIEPLFPDCLPGAIPPIGILYGIETLLDESLTTLANVYFEAGDHEHLVHVSGEAFLDLLRGVRRGHYSHDS